MGCALIMVMIGGSGARALAAMTETKTRDVSMETPLEILSLVTGKSFVLETASPVGRVAVGSETITQVRALSDESILIKGVAPGRTNLILWYKEGGTRVYDVVVDIDLMGIRRMVDRLFPEPGIELDAISAAVPGIGGGLLVHGVVPDAETLDRLMTLLKGFVPESGIRNFVQVTGPRQVQIDVRIAEVSRSNLKTMGFRWLYQRAYRRGDLLVGQGEMSRSGADDDSESGNATSGVIRSFADAVSQDIAGQGLGLVLSCLDGDLLAILDILETQNLAKILARPSLTAIGGRTAEFMVGGEFPVPVLDDGDVTIDYKEYGVKLAFSPTVVRKDTVYLDIQTSVSDIDYATTVGAAGTTVPGVTTREAKTSLELRDGQSFAIAGLLKENVSSAIDKIPFLGDLPILGALFRSKEFRKSETELVIVVTPHLVRPMNPDQVPPLPGDHIAVNQNAFDFIFMNRIGTPETDTPPVFQGPAGLEP